MAGERVPHRVTVTLLIQPREGYSWANIGDDLIVTDHPDNPDGEGSSYETARDSYVAEAVESFLSRQSDPNDSIWEIIRVMDQREAEA